MEKDYFCGNCKNCDEENFERTEYCEICLAGHCWMCYMNGKYQKDIKCKDFIKKD